MAQPAPPLPPTEPDAPLRRGVVVDVAKAYVEGLERDRRQLRELEQRYDRAVWDLIQISAYAKALYTALYQFNKTAQNGDLPPWDRIEDLLAADRRVYHEIWSCECGHHRWDHDDNGRCEYLACRRICGE